MNQALSSISPEVDYMATLDQINLENSSEVQEWIEEVNRSGGTSGFFAAVSRYYAQFLDTDFKKSRLPKRRLETKDKKNRRRGVFLKKYPGFEAKVWAEIQKAIGDGYRFTVSKGTYTATLPAATLNAVRSQIKQLTHDDVADDLTNLQSQFLQRVGSKPDPEIFREQFLEALRIVLVRKVVAPLLERLDAAVSSASSPVERLVELEDELSNYLIGPISEESSQALTDLIVERKTDSVEQLLTDHLSTTALHQSLENFFADFSAGDLFLDLREMIAVEQLGENDEFYMHLGEIHYKNHTFPLFYLPLQVSLTGSVIELVSDPHLFVNKKALDYISDDLKRIESSFSPFIIKDRLVYLDSSSRVVEAIETILSPVLVSLGLTGDSGDVDFGTPRLSEAKSSRLRMNNRLSVSLFDKSEESMVNDYEALLTGLEGGGAVVEFFEDLINQFLISEPESITAEVENNWDVTSIPDRLVFESPLPLAEEQRKILNAINHEQGRFILVEGPPGTGKSHTIAAIAFNQILSGKNLLILSDKKEALDVVERFLNDVLRQVRQGDDFQNPILRLGKTGSNFVKLVKPATVQKLQVAVKVAKNNEEALAKEHEHISSSLKAGLAATGESFKNISLADIQNYHEAELALVNEYPELEEDFDEEIELEQINDLRIFREYLQKSPEVAYEFFTKSGWDLAAIERTLERAWDIEGLPLPAELEQRIPNLTKKQSEIVASSLARLLKAKGLFGYLFKGKELAAISRDLSVALPDLQLDLKSGISFLRKIVDFAQELTPVASRWGGTEDAFEMAYFLGVRPRLPSPSEDERRAIARVISDIQTQEFPLDVEDDLEAALVSSESDLGDFLHRASELFEMRKKLSAAFENAPELDYFGEKRKFEALNAQRLANLVDERALNLSRENPADAKTLAKIIKDKSKFPTDKFGVLQKAFPCMIAGLRDYAEFIPLEKDLFDLVIIDEGSQVSIAQAWPAVLRAKKMLVLGDRKQFSNVKTTNASKEINNAWLNHVLSEFSAHFSDAGPSARKRAEIFNIQSSVMDFFEMVANYQTMLKKHFRSYPELISFSSKYFYESALQPLKVRAKPISEVIEFKEIDHDGKLDLTKNTNELEAEVIIDELEKLVDQVDPPSVAVITPHTEQQTLLSQLVTDHERAEEFRNSLKLRIFTFDTCQGEERDVIFYSLVATREKDRLGAIFLKSIDGVDDDALDSSVRLQRLNVGFSRAKEKIVIVHSKPIEEFNNSLKTALQHYRTVAKAALDMPTVEEVDPKSPMEAELLGWLTATPFVQQHISSNTIEILPQFPVGQYLKTLDPTYIHPAYRADFLLRVSEGDIKRNLIVEYDGFEHHFVSKSDVDAGNWTAYLTEHDVEREKVLESFGYKMLRVNRFNIGKDPVTTLDKRLKKLCDDLTKSSETHSLITEIAKTAQEQSQGLTDNTHRRCSKCGEVRPLDSFSNPENKSGRSRFCEPCRTTVRSGSSGGGVRSRRRSNSATSDAPSTGKIPQCPAGHGSMVLRTGKYGQFYGCSKFPSCRQTHKLR